MKEGIFNIVGEHLEVVLSKRDDAFCSGEGSGRM